jgi:ketosteroid isomerase-like protein
MMDVDDAEVVAQVWAAFLAYEQALVAHDVDALNDCFWRDPRAVRHGLEGTQRGFEEIASWRRITDPVPAGRTLHDTVLTTFGPDVAVVDTKFTSPGRDVTGRQSQVWVRVDGRWLIARAHVSEIGAQIRELSFP